MKPDKRVSTPAPIHKLKTVGEDKIGILCVDNSFRVLSLKDYKLLGGFKTTLQKNRPTICNGDLSANGAFASVYDQKNGVQLIYYSKTKRSVYRFSEHSGPVESTAFGPKSLYVATGGQDGKTYLWSLKSGKIVGNLPPHADFVTTISFSDNAIWLATGSFDKQINVTNISSMHQKFRLRGHSAAIKHLKFIKNQRLLAADKGGEIVVWNYMKQKVIKRLPKMLDEVTAFAVSGDHKFLFATDKTKRVSLYDLDSYEMVVEDLFKLKEVASTMEFSSYNSILSFGLISGEVLFFDTLQGEKKMQEDIEAKEYENAYELAKGNPLLKFTPTYELLEQEWEFHVDIAQKLLQEGKTKEAKQLLQPFSVTSSKRVFIQRLMKDFVAFEKFKQAVLSAKYPLAYSLAAQYLALEETKHYQSMEQKWKKALASVKQVIATKGGDDKAAELLKPFKGISKKAKTIQSIFEDRQVILLFQKKIAEQNYHDAIILTKKHPFLTDFDDYAKLLQTAQRLELQAKELLNAGKYAMVIRVCERLEGFPEKKEIAQELKDKAMAYAQAMKFYAEKSFSKLYKMVEKHPFLEDTQMLQKMEASWKKRVYEAENLAAKGEVHSIKELFKNFLSIEVKVPKIASILQLAYFHQIQSAIKQKDYQNSDIIAALERLIYLFGTDELVSDLVTDIKKVRKSFKINLDLVMEEGDIYSWRKKELPKDILNPKDG